MQRIRDIFHAEQGAMVIEQGIRAGENLGKIP
jgi:hypothetical protein